MDAADIIRTRCPVCRSKYMVPHKLVGHHARCSKCKATFLVAEDHRYPTEDDILRWLNEGMEEYEIINHPRIIKGGTSPNVPTKVGDLDPSGAASTSSLDVHSQHAGA